MNAVPRLFRNAFATIALCTALPAAAQRPAGTAGKIVWGFPITSYTVPLSDTATVVQILLPAGMKPLAEKQMGMLRGVAEGSAVDTGEKGWGRCHLIKGSYHYFAIHQKGPSAPQAGDLVYTFIPRPAGFSASPLARCAAHGVTFLDVEDSAFYKPEDFLKARTKAQNDALMQKLATDVQRTGKHYLEENPAMNSEIPDGVYKGRKMLDVMAAATPRDLAGFMEYIVARPRRYAGNRWKISETFATWWWQGHPGWKSSSEIRLRDCPANHCSPGLCVASRLLCALCVENNREGRLVPQRSAEHV